jgi:DNA-binding PadR family transcriptional regulator
MRAEKFSGQKERSKIYLTLHKRVEIGLKRAHEQSYSGKASGRAPTSAARGGGGAFSGRRGFSGMGGGEWGGRGRRRMFEGDALRLVMLLLLEGGPRHGYDIIREIDARTGGVYAPSPGIVYPTLTLLEELGQASSLATEGAKKLYAITQAGLAHLAEKRRDAEAAIARLDELRMKSEAMDSGPVFRAMSNLNAALLQRLSGQPEKDLLFSVADILDEAARKIERL